MKKVFNIVLLSIFIVIFSSCSTYYESSVSLEQASIQESKVRIETKNKEVDKYQKVIKEKDEYYGVSKSNEKELLVESNLKSVRLYDKSGSTINSILAGVGIAAVALTLIIITSF